MKFLMMAIATTFTVSTFASDKIVSVDGDELSYTGALTFKTDKAKTGGNPEENRFRVNLNYAQSLGEDYPGLMIKGVVSLDRRSSTEPKRTNSRVGVAAGALYNLDPTDVANSMFVGGLLGLERETVDNGTDDASGFNVTGSAEFGKRWSMGEYSIAGISYAPTLQAVYRRYGGDIRDEFYTSATEFRFNFLKFDILF